MDPLLKKIYSLNEAERAECAKHVMLGGGTRGGTTLGTMGASWISTRASGKFVGGSRFLGLTQPFIRVPNPWRTFFR